jgi:hypothetical protein
MHQDVQRIAIAENLHHGSLGRGDTLARLALPEIADRIGDGPD